MTRGLCGRRSRGSAWGDSGGGGRAAVTETRSLRDTRGGRRRKQHYTKTADLPRNPFGTVTPVHPAILRPVPESLSFGRSPRRKRHVMNTMCPRDKHRKPHEAFRPSESSATPT